MVVRLCEWGRTHQHDLTPEQRQAIEEAARRWKEDSRLNDTPLSFEGTDGRTLCARQWVGVVEAAGRTVEIYPKLDAGLLNRDEAVLDGDEVMPVLKSLLWMLSVTGELDVPDADTASLPPDINTFLDMWVYLLARNLRAELLHGAARSYQSETGDLSFVRGRIQFSRQVGALANRMDKIACRWDEFTPDTPMNRLLLCVCRTLRPLVQHRATAELLADCASLLDEVTDVAPSVALQETLLLAEGIGWGRTTERFRRVFNLAYRLLRYTGHTLGAGQADTFVFLLDMNKLFEKFAQAVLETHYGIPVEAQARLGYLLKATQGRILQKPDFRFKHNGILYLGDAKYKHLARDQQNSLTFTTIADVDEGVNETVAGRVLSAADVRQLGVYSELLSSVPPVDKHVLLLYPFVGSGSFKRDTAALWNDVPLTLLPVCIDHKRPLADAIPV